MANELVITTTLGEYGYLFPMAWTWLQHKDGETRTRTQFERYSEEEHMLLSALVDFLTNDDDETPLSIYSDVSRPFMKIGDFYRLSASIIEDFLKKTSKNRELWAALFEIFHKPDFREIEFYPLPPDSSFELLRTSKEINKRTFISGLSKHQREAL